MLIGAMRRRLLPLALSLLLLIAQQLGTQHLLAHVLQLDGHGHAGQTQATLAGSPAIPDGPATQAEAGDALCQVCLVLATLVALAGPAAWAWAAQHVRRTAPQPPVHAAPRQRAWAPYRARGPPGRPAAA